MFKPHPNLILAVESIRIFIEQQGTLLSPGLVSDSPRMESPDQVAHRAQAYEGLRQLIATYWVLLVVGAFLLVIMSGDPSFLKTIYLVFFFIFMITYQVLNLITQAANFFS